MDVIESLPKSMVERALKARQLFIEKPKESQIDDNGLVWCFDSEDEVWYSIAGNYSGSSPEEKRIKNGVYEQNQEKQIVLAQEYYEKVIYYSKIRKQALERDDYTCQICGKEGASKLHAHHIVKRKENGSDCLDNLITCCVPCHKKADKELYNPKWK